VAVDRGDDWLWAFLHHRDIRRVERLFAFALEFGDIGAGDKAAPSTDQDDGGRGGIGNGGFERRFERRAQRMAGRIDGRVIDGEQRYLADMLGLYQRLSRGHGEILVLPWARLEAQGHFCQAERRKDA
jgi:hypothetical protein